MSSCVCYRLGCWWWKKTWWRPSSRRLWITSVTETCRDASSSTATRPSRPSSSDESRASSETSSEDRFIYCYTPVIYQFIYQLCVCLQVRAHQSSLWVERSAQNKVSWRVWSFSGTAQVYAGNTHLETHTWHLPGPAACLSLALTLCVCLSQGMDPVVRQVGQHIEMEPEWEAAFTLQMKLTHIISMIQEWCSTDVSTLMCTSTLEYTQVLHTAIHNTAHSRTAGAGSDLRNQHYLISVTLTTVFKELQPHQ